MASNYEPWPLDYRILELIPEVGMVGGVHWKGRRVRDLAADLTTAEVPIGSPQVQSRLSFMKKHGLVVHYPSSGGRIWAKTAEGVRMQRHDPTPAFREDDHSSEEEDNATA